MITYCKTTSLQTEEVIMLFESSGIIRPTSEPERIKKMIENASLIITAWDGDQLVGIARCMSDFSYCCYLSDLAVKKEYQDQKIGKTLIEKVRREIGDLCSLVLLSAPQAMEYYPKVGFDKAENAFLIKRK